MHPLTRAIGMKGQRGDILLYTVLGPLRTHSTSLFYILQLILSNFEKQRLAKYIFGFAYTVSALFYYNMKSVVKETAIFTS